MERTIRFLDLKLRFSPNHICWAHEPHASKPLLPFQWSHSKLVKRSMVRTCLWNALNKSCIHSIPESFSKQMDRLQAGYPKQQLSSATESFLQKLRNKKVVFSAPNKLSSMCSRVNKTTRTLQSCSTKLVNQFVNCVQGVVYSVPLSCGRKYVGQTGRCLNERQKEHHYNVHKVICGHLGLPYRDCGCSPIFLETIVIAKNKQKNH